MKVGENESRWRDVGDGGLLQSLLVSGFASHHGFFFLSSVMPIYMRCPEI